MISLSLQLCAKKSRSLLLDRFHQRFHFVDGIEHALHFAFVTEKIANAGVDLFLPYGVADSSVCFAFVAIKEILTAMR